MCVSNPLFILSQAHAKLYRYQFANLLGCFREIMRPGVLWFIKDPQDQNFHPVRDILDRPAWTQFGKLLQSVRMYAITIAATCGLLGGFIWMTRVLPLQWDPM
jgi:E3 ubiquitin-protein ligase MARCH6